MTLYCVTVTSVTVSDFSCILAYYKLRALPADAVRLEVLEEGRDVLELLFAVEAGQVHLVHRELADGHVVAEVGNLGVNSITF